MKFIGLIKKIEEGVAKANFNLRPDITNLLELSLRSEKNQAARQALEWILENSKIAGKQHLPICQDTGLPIVFIEAGKDVKISQSLIQVVETAVATGYKNNSLRPSLTDPLVRNKFYYRGITCHVDFSPKKSGLKITIFPKGFGSENKSRLKMFNPTTTIDQIENFIVECVKTAGPESCPPFIVGVGIGGTSDTALLLAKKALLERVDKPNTDKVLRKIEERVFKQINTLAIGPMGLGGKCTVLAVKVKKALTHIAGLPVGVNISCHALRSATIKI